MSYYVQPHLEEIPYDAAIIHVGVNDFLKDNKATVENLIENIQNTVNQCKRYKVRKILISSIVYTPLLTKEIVHKANEAIRLMCNNFDYYFISNDNITRKDLYDNLHLRTDRLEILANNFINSVNYF